MYVKITIINLLSDFYTKVTSATLMFQQCTCSWSRDVVLWRNTVHICTCSPCFMIYMKFQTYLRKIQPQPFSQTIRKRYISRLIGLNASLLYDRIYLEVCHTHRLRLPSNEPSIHCTCGRFQKLKKKYTYIRKNIMAC